MKLEINEVQILNQAISNSTIKGSDAKTVSVIINKLEKEFERLYKLQEKSKLSANLEEHINRLMVLTLSILVRQHR